MNLLDLIRDKSRTFPEHVLMQGIEAVILHIERAETYWYRAKKEGDMLLFTDVIYRTNQAFEGILKEAYALLADKAPDLHMPIHKIEAFLNQGNVFHPRVMSAFTEYRTRWRNEATHDYTLVFSEEEALLAINSVSTFCLILLDQMLTKARAIAERQRVQAFSAEVRNRILGYRRLPWLEKILKLLELSYAFMMPLQPASHAIEAEYLAGLCGFLEAVDGRIVWNLQVPPQSEYWKLQLPVIYLSKRGGEKQAHQPFMKQFMDEVQSVLLVMKPDESSPAIYAAFLLQLKALMLDERIHVAVVMTPLIVQSKDQTPFTHGEASADCGDTWVRCLKEMYPDGVERKIYFLRSFPPIKAIPFLAA